MTAEKRIRKCWLKKPLRAPSEAQRRNLRAALEEIRCGRTQLYLQKMLQMCGETRFKPSKASILRMYDGLCSPSWAISIANHPRVRAHPSDFSEVFLTPAEILAEKKAIAARGAAVVRARKARARKKALARKAALGGRRAG